MIKCLMTFTNNTLKTIIAVSSPLQANCMYTPGADTDTFVYVVDRFGHGGYTPPGGTLEIYWEDDK